MATHGQLWHKDKVSNADKTATFKSPGYDMYLLILGAVVAKNTNYTISMAGLNEEFKISYTGKKRQSTTTLSGLSLQTLPTGKEVTVWHSANTSCFASDSNSHTIYSWGAFFIVRNHAAPGSL